jgi:Protein-tyrosine phosphatase
MDLFTGPLETTQDDFWLMVWEFDCRRIVMLTNLEEKKKVLHIIGFILFERINFLFSVVSHVFISSPLNMSLRDHLGPRPSSHTLSRAAYKK